MRSRLHILLKRFSLYQFFLPLIIKDLQSLAEAAAKATAIQLNCSINLSFTVHVFDIFNATSILNSLYQFLLRHFQESIDYVCVWFLLCEHAILLLFVRHSHSVFFSLSLDGNRIERSAYSNDIRSLSFIFIYFMSIQYLNNEISGTPKKQRMERARKTSKISRDFGVSMLYDLSMCVCMCVTSFSTCPDNSNYPLLIKYVNIRR